MDRSLKFFTDIDTPKSNKDPNTGLVGSNFETQVSTSTYDPNDPLKSTGNSETKTYNYQVVNSGQADGKFVNYMGNSTTNDYQPYKSNPEHESDINLSSIIQWSQKHPGLLLKPDYFVYLKDFNVYPANRLMVLRRFTNAVDHNIFDLKYKPNHTMVTYYTLEESPIKISFKEKWKDFDSDFVEVLQNVIGLKFSTIPGVGKLFDLGSVSNLGQEIMNMIGKKLGFVSDGGMPYGDPNIIHEAKIRDVSGEGVSTGLESKVNIDFETTYVMKEIPGGPDAKAAMLDIIANVVAMGTSPERFYITGTAASQLRNLIRAFKNGDTSGIFRGLIDGISDIINGVIKLMTDTIDSVKEATKSGENNGNSKLSAALDAILGKVSEIGGEFLKNRYSRYKWQLQGAVAALSGMHTTPWHLTIGNPKFPWFSCGNMLVTNIELEAGGELGYNDMFSELKVKIKLESGRSMGSNGLTSLFNAGRGRIYDTPDKIQNIEIPNNSNKLVMGSPIINDNLDTQEQITPSDTDNKNDLEGITDFGNNTIDTDENLQIV